MNAHGWYLQPVGNAQDSARQANIELEQARSQALDAAMHGDCKKAREIAFATGNADLEQTVAVSCPQ